MQFYHQLTLVLELFDERENLEQVIGEEITNENIVSFHETVAFYQSSKNNISSRFAYSGDIVLILSIFDPRKLPSVDSEDLKEKLPSKHFLNTMVQKNQLRHYWVKPKLRNQRFPVMSPRSGKLSIS